MHSATLLDISKMSYGQIDGQIEIEFGQGVNGAQRVAESGACHIAAGRVVRVDELVAAEYKIEPLHQ